MKRIELIEKCAEAVHKAYCKYYLKNKGVEYWTKGDYSLLDEATKQIDRETVKAVLEVTEIHPVHTVLGQPEAVRFCNDCDYLLPTEKQQDISGVKGYHRCLLFKKIVKHGRYHPNLPKLKECSDLGKIKA